MSIDKSKNFVRAARFLKFLLRGASLLLASSILAFFLISISPIDPVQQYLLGSSVTAQQREEVAAFWGADTPPVTRYFNWLCAFLQGDMGTSLLYRQPVSAIIQQRFVNSAFLMAVSWILSGILSVTIGCIISLFRTRFSGRLLHKICYLLCSTPPFWLGLLLLFLFAVKLGWFPVGLSAPIGVLAEDITLPMRIRHLILPALTLALASFPSGALHIAQKLDEMMQQDYILFARARGFSNWEILTRHGMRNLCLPVVTLQFSSFAELFGGSILAETVFSYAGLGSTISAAGLGGDVPLLLAITVFSTLFVFLGNTIAQIIYAFADPRVLKEGM